MPAEPMTLLLRPRNFFTRNPALDVPPSFCSVPSRARQQTSVVDGVSKLAFGGSDGACCSSDKFGGGV
jgi:primary-amine oxidase